MSEIHVEHRRPERFKESMSESRSLWKSFKALVIDMIPVILGILVALSFNSIKEARKEHQEALYFLQRIQADLKEDLAELEQDLLQYRQKKKAAAYLRAASLSSSTEKDSAFYYFRFLPGQTAPNITNAAYFTLLSGGKLGLIEDKAIVEALVLLYTDVVPGLVNTTRSFNEFKARSINDVVYTELDYEQLNATKDLTALLANLKVKNALTILWFDEVIERYQTAIAAHKQLIEKIDANLHG